jgi:hypothetical protein
LIVVAVLTVLAACSSDNDAGQDTRLATLENSTTLTTTGAFEDAESNAEEAVLAFSQCMRDEGFAAFPDPQFSADGSLDFERGQNDLEQAGIDTQSDKFQAAFGTCQNLLEGVALIGGGIDLTEIEDLLLEFAQCMRRQGVDMADPSLNFGPGGGDPFGGSVDFGDPDVQAAFELCQAEVNFERLLDDSEEPG